MYQPEISTMESLKIEKTNLSPEISLSHNDRVYRVEGRSRPEDVRELYYPVVKWMDNYKEFLCKQGNSPFTEDKPLIFEFDLDYFNSSSAKFLYDIIFALKNTMECGIPVKVIWYHDAEDIDMQEAGEDLAILADIEFEYITK